MTQPLTPPEVAKLLRVSHQKVLRLIGDGSLKAYNVAMRSSKVPRWRVDLSEIEAYKARGANPTPFTPPSQPRRKKQAFDCPRYV